MEEITKYLCSKGYIGSEWNDELKNLLARKNEVRTKTIPRVSSPVIVVALVAIITPILKTIVDGFVQDKPLCAALITAIPLLAAIFWGVVYWAFTKFRKKGLLRLGDLFYLYKGEELESEVHTTTSERNPSIRDFQDWIEKLASSIKRGKGLVVVFDNMDRLPPEKVHGLWSTIQTFFADECSEGRNIWVIVPFDRKHIEDAFKKYGDVSDKFIKKTFSITYRVAPPVMTDWKKLFDSKYSEAFGETEDADLHTVRTCFGKLMQPITPRDIISFINELVAIKLVWKNDIPLKYIGIFVAAKKEILKEPIEKQILNKRFLGTAEDMFWEDHDLQKNIAALAYQVPVEIGMQVALTNAMSTAIRDEDIDEFLGTAEYPDFAHVLEHVVDMDDHVGRVKFINALSKLDKEANYYKSAVADIQKVWDRLGISRARFDPLYEQAITESDKVLLKNLSPRVARQVSRSLIGKALETKDEAFDGGKYGQMLLDLDILFQNKSADIDVSSIAWGVTVKPKAFLECLAVVKGYYRKYKVNCGGAELVEFVSRSVPNELGGLSCLEFLNGSFDLSPVITRMEKAVKSNEITHENVGAFFAAYKAIASEKPIKPLSTQNIQSISPHLQPSSAIAIDLMAMNLAQQESLPGFSTALKNELWENSIPQIAEVIEFYNSFGSMMTEYLNHLQPNMKPVLRHLVENPYGVSRARVGELLERFDQLVDALELEPIRLLTRLNSWSKHAEEKIGASSVAELFNNSKLFEICLDSTDIALAKHLKNVATEHLDSIGQEDWNGYLQNEKSEYFRVLHLFLDRDLLKPLPDTLVAAYKEILVMVAEGQFVFSNQAFWNLLFKRTNKSELTVTAKNMRDIFIQKLEITPKTFSMISIPLLECGNLKEYSANAVRRILTPVVGDPVCRSLILNYKERLVPLVKSAKEEAGDFKQKVAQVLEAEGEQSHDGKLLEFAHEIGAVKRPSGGSREPRKED